ncbi:MAG: NTP/NDP exchange transporter [Vicinamibacteria bacterium]
MSEKPCHENTLGLCVDRALRVFGDVRPGEGATVVLLFLNVFLVLAGYYVAKTAREPLILAGGGAELKSYAAAGQALALMAFIPLYSWFTTKVDRGRLVLGVSAFFALNLELFWLGARIGVPYLGVAFFIWVGIFNNAVVAQFWSYGNDLFDPDTGKRLFPVIGIGMALGSPVGSQLAASLFDGGVSAYSMLHVTAVMLAVSMFLYHLVERREGRKRALPRGGLQAGANGFLLLAQSRYLRLICLLLLVLNLVNTTGEYVLGRAVVTEAARLAAGRPGFDEQAFIGSFYGGYYFWVNVATFLIQALVVSRLVAWLGLAGALLALPIVALGAYGGVAAGATFVVIRWAKTAENSMDYSVMNTARQLLWLPTSREEKYKAKQAADTFIVRAGDVLSAGLVWLGTQVLALDLRGFAFANLLFVGLWLALAVLLLREYRALSAPVATAPSGAAAAAV